MTTRTSAMLRVATGQGLIPRPRLLERLLTMFDVQRTRSTCRGWTTTGCATSA